MKTKRLLALLAALVMLLALLGACSNDTADGGKTDDGQTDQTDDPKTGGEDKEDGGETDVPENTDLPTISWLGRGTTDNLRLAVEGDYANYKELLRVIELYGFVLESSQVDTSVYPNTINSLAAANQLPDCFATRGVMDNATVATWIESGRFISCSDIIQHSSGNMATFFSDNGTLAYCKAIATVSDGDWYQIIMTNNSARRMQITESDGPLRAVTQVGGAYDMMIRQDWLDDLGLGMPATAEEYYDACLAMNQNDINGNGQNDERIILGLGTEYQYQGIGQWFGLPYMDFREDPSDGHIEVAMLCEGFGDWAAYMNRLYDGGVIYNNEGGNVWSNMETFFAENNVITWFRTANGVWSSGQDNSGDPECNYQPMPIIQAVEGVAPRMVVQEGVACEYAVSFNADTCTPENAAKMVDFAFSYELYLVYYFGVEGMAWEFEEDGVTVDAYTNRPDYKKGDIENQYLSLQGMDNAFMGMVSYCPNPKSGDLWSTNACQYSTYQQAIDADEPYSSSKYDEAEWMRRNEWNESSPTRKSLQQIADYGEENINWAAYYSFTTLPTNEEIEVMNQYGTDLKTFLQEVATKLVTGEYDIADLESYIDYAYEIGLQEYIDAVQASVDRYMVAMGLKN